MVCGVPSFHGNYFIVISISKRYTPKTELENGTRIYFKVLSSHIVSVVAGKSVAMHMEYLASMTHTIF